MSRPSAPPEAASPHEARTATPSDRGDGFFAPVRGRLGLIVGLALLGAVSGIVPFIAIIELARTFLAEDLDAGRAWTIVAITVVALLVSFVAAFASGMVGHLADADLQRSVRARIVGHLQRLPLGWFGTRTSGEVRKLVENDVTALHQLVAHTIQDVVTAISVPAIALAYLFAVQWRIALVALIPIAITVALYALMMRGGAEKFARYDEASARLSSATVEFVHGIAVVKRFGRLGRSHRRYRAETADYVGFVGQWTRDTALWFTMIEIVTSPVVVLVLILGVGGLLVSTGAAAPLDLVAGVLLGLGLTGPLMKLGSSAQFVRNAAKAQESLAGFLAIPPIAEAAAPVRPAGASVGADSVSFGYEEGHLALRDVTAHGRAGTVTALVGASGSGKSTLAKLVPRFYDVEAGRITIGGADVRELASEELYGAVGFVFQDVQLLRASLRDNIRLTRPDADDAEVERAARAAQIHDRILRFDRGYDAVVGEDANLSGGEAQRVTIARALLADAPVLVLDEATAFADPDSEAAIQAAITALSADRTVIVIAHRLHTIVDVDQILVLHEGRLVEVGTHAELVAAGGRFARMWAAYTAGHARAVPEGVTP